MAKPAISTQQFLPFSAIYDDIVVSKKGQFCEVLMVNSVNFGLKSEEEQNAIIGQYQGFLNALSFPIEIVMHSKQLDLSNYIKDLKGRIAQEANELIRYQIQEYVDFIQKLVSIANIMDKKFFIVVPYQLPVTEQSQGGFLAGFFGSSHPHLKVPLSRFTKIKEELDQHVNVVMSGLSSMGISSQVLSTKQIIEVFYRTYNPEEAVKEKLQENIEAVGAIEDKAKEITGAGQDQAVDVPVNQERSAPARNASSPADAGGPARNASSSADAGGQNQGQTQK